MLFIILYKNSHDGTLHCLFYYNIIFHSSIFQLFEFLFFFLCCFNDNTVVAQSYKVEVEILAASRGCTAILRCIVPNFVKELVRVVSWVQEPAFYIYPSLQGGMYTNISVV